MHDPRISALLRLKRYEEPPPGYFDQLLQEVHRRQREELLHRPLWKIALERMQVFFSEHSMGNLSYAGAMAGMLVAGIVAITVLTHGEPQTAGTSQVIAKAEPQVELSAAEPGTGSNRMLLQHPQGGWELASHEPQKAGPQLSAPRYVIDARPASYEPAFSF